MGVGRWQDGEPRVAGDEAARLDALARPTGRFSTAITNRLLFGLARLRPRLSGLSIARRRCSHRPRPSPRAGTPGARSGHGAVCAPSATRSCEPSPNSRDSNRAEIPRLSRAITTPPATICATACGCGGRSFPRSPIPDDRSGAFEGPRPGLESVAPPLAATGADIALRPAQPGQSLNAARLRAVAFLKLRHPAHRTTLHKPQPMRSAYTFVANITRTYTPSLP